jgi:hypothetical protein
LEHPRTLAPAKYTTSNKLEPDFDAGELRASRRGRQAARDAMLIKALVRAHRWRRRIESGRAKSVTDLAEQERAMVAYVCRLLPLTCLAPDIVEAILDGRQPKGLRLAELLRNGRLAWDEQRSVWGFSRAADRWPPNRWSQAR